MLLCELVVTIVNLRRKNTYTYRYKHSFENTLVICVHGTIAALQAYFRMSQASTSFNQTSHLSEVHSQLKLRQEVQNNTLVFLHWLVLRLSSHAVSFFVRFLVPVPCQSKRTIIKKRNTWVAEKPFNGSWSIYTLNLNGKLYIPAKFTRITFLTTQWDYIKGPQAVRGWQRDSFILRSLPIKGMASLHRVTQSLLPRWLTSRHWGRKRMHVFYTN